MKCPPNKELVKDKCYVKCKEGQLRNLQTNRCKKSPKAICKPSQELYKGKCLKKCSPGHIRNPKTRRCRKSQEVVIEVKKTIEHLVDFFNKNDIKINHNSLLYQLSKLKQLPKTSTSQSKQGIVNYKDLVGVIKVWRYGEKCLSAEYLIYKYITPFLYYQNISPNVLIPISVGRATKEQIQPLLSAKMSKVLLNDDIEYVITPFFKQHLHDFLDKKNFEEYYNVIFFLVFYNLASFAKIGLRHNDLHIENIRLNKLKQKIKTWIKYEGLSFEINTDIDLILFDFDRSGLSDPGNTLLKSIGEDYNKVSCATHKSYHCKRIGQCTKPDEGRRDVWTFIIHMCQKSQELRVQHLMEPILKAALTESGMFWINSSNILYEMTSDEMFWTLILMPDDVLKNMVNPIYNIITNQTFLKFALSSKQIRPSTAPQGQTYYSYDDDKINEFNMQEFVQQYYN